MADQAQQQTPKWEVPPPLPARERGPRREPAGRGYLLPNIGTLEPVRARVLNRLGQLDAPVLSLDEAKTHLQFLNTNQRVPEQRQPRALPSKTYMDDLYKVVQDGKRDIKLIKDAQSKQGANEFILKHGLQDQLYVDDRDIDGDTIPDIIVRSRADNSPYIVKGYTTEQSSYPHRYKYFTEYPTAEERKGNPMRDYLEDYAVQGYSFDGQARQFDPEFASLNQKILSRGYKSLAPKPKLSPVQAFKRFIMKPVMTVIKKFYKFEAKDPLQIPADVAVKVEAILRNNLITAPVMVRVYGADVLQVQDPKDWHKLSQRKEVKQGVSGMMGEFIQQRILFAGDFVKGILDQLEILGVRVPNKDKSVPLITQFLQQDEDFNAPKLPRPE
jgi:hypothetical protein